jgi:hypothetical protein
MRAAEHQRLNFDPMTKQISSDDLARLQCEQHAHDMRNHFDIFSRHKTDRLKHYGLHYAKYVGRLARGSIEPKPAERTIIDALLVSLSAANTLHQDLSKEGLLGRCDFDQVDALRVLADAAGRFADACEKIDHMEEFIPLARQANVDIINWIVREAARRGLNLLNGASVRRAELAARLFYILD